MKRLEAVPDKPLSYGEIIPYHKNWKQYKLGGVTLCHPFFWMKTLDQIIITLKSKSNQTHNVYIDVVENSLSAKWLTYLNQTLRAGLHLEKNYHWIGFTERDAQLICNEINQCIEIINSHADNWKKQGIEPYTIDDHFTPENTITDGDVGYEKPGCKIIHERTNWLHRYFEDLQGHHGAISKYYTTADAGVKQSIRKLNLLCHELESFVLSARKRQYAPEWVQYNQLFCFLNSFRFPLDPETDFDLFGIHTLNRSLGEVYIGVNKSVSKTHWEVFNDEKDADLDELVTTALKPQIVAAADFDISWSRDSKGHPWLKDQLNEFEQWLIKHGWDPQDPSLTIGNPLIANVNLTKSFNTEDTDKVQSILTEHLDVVNIATSDESCSYPYHWADNNYNQLQSNLL